MTDQNRLQEERDSLRNVLNVVHHYFDRDVKGKAADKNIVLKAIKEHKAKFEKPDWVKEMNNRFKQIQDTHGTMFIHADLRPLFNANILTAAMDEYILRIKNNKVLGLREKINYKNLDEEADKIRKELEG